MSLNGAGLLDTLPIPIIQAPMVGASSLDMAIAVSKAGGLGWLGLGGADPYVIEPQVKAVRAATDRPFGVNMFVLEPAAPAAEEVDRAIERLRPWYEARGLPVPAAPNDFAPDFSRQFEALVRAAPPAASFTFGALSSEQVAALKAQGVLVIGTATNVAEARVWVEVGADAISAQGSEAGGHRGTFIGEARDMLVGTMALVPLIAQATGLPVIAAGGIMDGRGVAAALALGAVVAQMGTAFLLSDQTAISPAWQRAARTAPDDPTRLTRAFTGRHARGLENDFMRQMRGVEDQVPDYPVQNRLTQPLRAAGARMDDPEVISLWAGQGVKLAGPGDAGALVQRWWDEAKAVAADLAARTAR